MVVEGLCKQAKFNDNWSTTYIDIRGRTHTHTTDIFIHEPDPSSRLSADTVLDFNVPSPFDKGKKKIHTIDHLYLSTPSFTIRIAPTLKGLLTDSSLYIY